MVVLYLIKVGIRTIISTSWHVLGLRWSTASIGLVIYFTGTDYFAIDLTMEWAEIAKYLAGRRNVWLPS